MIAYKLFIIKIVFNEHKDILEWECPKAFRPYRLIYINLHVKYETI